MSVRVRMAPSPTGFLHIGGVRTFLFNWLFARGQGGECLLRIENTDTSREVAESVEQIQSSLRWLGIDWDGEVTFQLDRLERCAQEARRLVDEGKAYEDEGAIRFRMPDEGTTAWDDAVKGRIEFPNEQLEDLVLVRTDGRPTYNFASPVEDWLDGITHVIRGDDHVSNTPEADPDPAGARLRDPDVRARAERLRRGRQEALEASRRRLGGRVPRGGVHRAGADELPRAARLGAGRRDDDHVAGRADRALLARAGRRQPGDVRLREARLDERRLPARALAGGLRRHADRLPARAGIRLAGRADPCRGADRAGEDREAGGVPRVRRLPLPRRRARSGPARPRRADGGRGGARRGRAVGGVAARGDVSSR